MDDGRSQRLLPQRRLRARSSGGEASADAASSPGRRLELAFILNESDGDRRPSQPRDTATATDSERRPARAAVPAAWSPLEVASPWRRAPSPPWLLEETKHWMADGATLDEEDEKTDVVQGEDAARDIERLTLQEPAIMAPVSATTSPGAAVAAPAQALSREEKRKGRMCRVDGCDNYIVHKGLCCRHGGARKCSTEGCESTAKYMGLCWKHGGSTWCKVAGCSKRAKAKGKCWAHGGGTQCGQAECTKVAVSNGLCWAHGGGKRCLVDGCNRPGYERTNGFCDRHFEEVQHSNYFEV